ncbi:hypothetical protein [Legionella maioricensis]|uniref:Transmembrane protein n=1 Tax=Legionella maioricensis TaxID=2896528 RepID=A0A9X2D2Y1_9GAMM|nr:hypothetical protein [Legionella maioricensis]MCL9685584.1 hypothetical protein [Legionella maioricensis]MCL9688913.1 hypothetical protein [Legionella maioricensis]
MMQAGNFIIKHSKALLENKQHAILYAVILSIVPFASWLSVALVILVTLRKGAKPGFEVMLPALVVHSVPLMMLLPLESALTNTLIAYVPCYIAALCLRKTMSWQMVFGVFLIQAFIGFLFIQLLAPDFIVGQFNQFKNMLTEYQEYQRLIESNSDGLSSFILAQLFFGVQILSVIVSAIISLMFARSIQSKLFMPGGFRDELLAFRSGRLSFLVLLGVSIASYYEISYAINLLPLVLCYFLVSGFSLAYYILARKNQVRVVILLFLLVLFKPSFVLLAYVVLGSLDSLFNFRLYLPTRVREST